MGKKIEPDPRDTLRGYDPDPRDFPYDVTEYSAIEDLMVWKAFLAASKTGKEANSDDFQKEMYKSYRKYLKKENRNPAYKEMGISNPYEVRSKNSIKNRFLDKVGPDVMHFSSIMGCSVSQCDDQTVEESYADSLAVYEEKCGRSFGFNLSNTYYLDNRDKVDELIEVSLAPTFDKSFKSSSPLQHGKALYDQHDSYFSPLHKAFGAALEAIHELVPLANNEERNTITKVQTPYNKFSFETKNVGKNVPPPGDVDLLTSDSVSQLKCDESIGFGFDLESPESRISETYDMLDSASHVADYPINSKDLNITKYDVLLKGKTVSVNITEITNDLENEEQNVSFESSVQEKQVPVQQRRQEARFRRLMLTHKGRKKVSL